MRTCRTLAFALAVTLVWAAMILGGGGTFLNLPAMVMCLGLTLLLGVLSFGPEALWAGLSSVGSLFSNHGSHEGRPLKDAVLRGLILHAYVSGALGALIALVQMLRALSPGADLALMIMRGMAAMLLCPLYGALLAELLLRPALHSLKTTE